MASNLETMIFEIIARDKNASEAFDRFRRSVDGTTTSVDKNTSSLAKNEQAQKSAMGAAIGTGVALSALASPLASAAAGVVAYGTLAAPSILKVKTALTGPGGLAAAWGTLDNRQKNMAAGVQNLSSRYHDLSLSMEPRVAQTFGTALGIVNSALGPFSQLAAASGTALESFLVQFSHQSGLNQFITFMAREAGPAIRLLGTDITNISHAVFQLLESWGGIGLAELKAVTTVITGITASLSWLSVHAPGLTGVAVGITGIAIALSKLGLLSGALKLTGLAVIPGQLALVSAGMKDATLATRGFAVAETAVRAITPFGWAVIAATAVGALAFALDKTDKAEQDLIATTAKQSRAQGFNTAGYKAAAKQLDLNAAAMARQFEATERGRGAMNGLGTAYRETTQQGAAWNQGVAQQNQLMTTLQRQYGLTRTQAVALAAAAGVQVDKNGQLVDGFKNSVTEADAFANANLRARRPVMGLAAAVTFLTAAMQKNIGTTLTLQGDQNAYQVQLMATNKQLASNSAGLKGNSANAIANRGQVISLTNAVISFASEQLTAKGDLHAASSEILAQIAYLQRHGDRTKFARDEIAALLKEEALIKAQIGTTIVVHGTGSWATSQIGGPHAARGLFINSGQPGVDDQLILAQRNELVVPPDIVRSDAVDHLRGRIPGFAAGGVVGSYGDGVTGLTRWLKTENAATLLAIENATARGLLAAHRAAMSGGGPGGAGPAGGAAHWAPVILAALGLLGQSPSWLGAVESRMNRESGGNPTIVNRWDSNWARGTPSVGLMQVIGPTFAAYAGGFRRTGPFEYGVSVNPLANTYAGLNYGLHRYGDLRFLTAPGGYDEGGWLMPGQLGINRTGTPERVVSPREERAMTDRLDTLIAGISELIGAVYTVAPDTAGGVASVLGGAAKSAHYTGLYGA